MKILRYSKSKEFSDNTGLIRDAGLGLALSVGGYALNKFSKNRLDNSKISKEQKNIYNKIKKEIKDRNVEIIDDFRFTPDGVSKNAGYSPKNKKIEEFINKNKREIDKEIEKQENEINKIKNSKEKEKEKDKLNAFKNFLKIGGKGGYIIDKDLHRGDIVAHERGHEHYIDGEGKKSLGGVLHKVDNYTSIEPIDKPLSFFSGMISESEGEDESTLNKYGHLIFPTARAISKVGSEAAASIKGYKLLKKSGASKETLKESKKNLTAALGTYAGSSLRDFGTSLASRALGRYVGKKLNGEL